MNFLFFFAKKIALKILKSKKKIYNRYYIFRDNLYKKDNGPAKRNAENFNSYLLLIRLVITPKK